jgi:hypothetical protein
LCVALRQFVIKKPRNFIADLTTFLFIRSITNGNF